MVQRMHGNAAIAVRRLSSSPQLVHAVAIRTLAMECRGVPRTVRGTSAAKNHFDGGNTRRLQQPNITSPKPDPERNEHERPVVLWNQCSPLHIRRNLTQDERDAEDHEEKGATDKGE